jgi:hypothetical protein
MRHALVLLALTAAVGCGSPASVADDLSFDIPAGFIGKGSTVEVAIVNDSEHDAQTGSLPCVVRLDQLVAGKWEAGSIAHPCPAVVTPVPAQGLVSFDYPMPDEIGTYRLVVGIVIDGGTGVISTRTFQTVGIAID